MPRQTLTQAFIDNGLTCPKSQAKIEYVDTDGSGVYVEVRSTAPGVGRFYLRKKFNGKALRRALGPTTDITLAEAKALAQAEIDMAKGKAVNMDPSLLTLEYFVEHKYLPYKRSHIQSASLESIWERRLKPRFGKKKLFEITRMEVEEYLISLQKTGLAPSTCNHHIRALRNIFNVAVQWDLINKSPLKGIKLLHEDNQIERYLREDELALLMETLNTHSNQGLCLLVKFLLYTGARVSEALKADWSQINYDTSTWWIPAANSKSKKLLAKPLSKQALSVLEELRELGPGGPNDMIFISTEHGRPLQHVNKSWDRLRKSIGLDDLRLHDLRHNYASTLVNSGESLYVVQHLLGHSSSRTTQRYAHLATDTLQSAANSAGDRISGAAKKAS